MRTVVVGGTAVRSQRTAYGLLSVRYEAQTTCIILSDN
ncbi:hypothetical protein DFP92_101330 [Yoonia sediminilitoris]|uniref:Uncharacterized protein n=1 Tax=Yoonia sediminilitoris TaxID=1286148 RepID=A0A2T6KQA8_9RHOB|nr:hypothetical protein C8N45_101330 [Yoonia sediminilitoris]RCW98912.1 hypothetical protein DFP92_101330 [Yoonia sediminilitoris]